MSSIVMQNVGTDWQKISIPLTPRDPSVPLPSPVLITRTSTQRGSMRAGSRPDVLFLAHRVPYPPDKGDKIRSFHQFGDLRRLHSECLAKPLISTSALVF